jgi:hypothetical protein
MERWFRTWKSEGTASVEVCADLEYNDERLWVEKKREALLLFDLLV